MTKKKTDRSDYFTWQEGDIEIISRGKEEKKSLKEMLKDLMQKWKKDK